ncbi:MAG: tRNA (adenosine(37)-N6)-dimethylallyltransferase MiaA [Nitrospiraceae bacterium]|nr:tRNA (adenosine(37)-N6)-dimethylallyltransferase MiaA [Nitrospiraceae bacterium]
MEKVIIVLGPTCSGKTAASIELALALGAEIISADSMQVYKGMDIGTAKPSKEELESVPHHLINIIEPFEEFSAGRFVEEALPAIKRLHGQGRIPVITGGTGLYIRALTRGLFSAPPADTELREKLLAMEIERKGSLYEMLLKEDPSAAQAISPGDTRRIVRGLEVSIKTGTAMSALQKNLTAPMPFEFIKIGLQRDRAELYNLINKRVDWMMQAGLLDEVKRIIGSVQGAKLSKTAMQAIGYKELGEFLNGLCTLEEAVPLIKRNTRRYAKRQTTWFKKEEDVLWVDVTGATGREVIAARIFPVVKGAGINL